MGSEPGAFLGVFWRSLKLTEEEDAGLAARLPIYRAFAPNEAFGKEEEAERAGGGEAVCVRLSLSLSLPFPFVDQCSFFWWYL